MATQLNELDVDLITRGHLERGLARLRDEFAGTFSSETVERYMTESLAALGGARVTNFVPLFVHRFARERLRALGQVEGKIAKDVPEVLFVCVQNAGRSQMAAALLDHSAAGRVHVRSAGSAPGDQINPAVVVAMSELGIDVSREFPKPMTDEARAGGRCGHHDGLRRRLPDLPGQTLRGLEDRRPRRRRPQRRPTDPRRNRRTRTRAAHPARSAGTHRPVGTRPPLGRTRTGITRPSRCASDCSSP